MLSILKKECFEQTLKFIEMQEKYFRMGIKGQLNKLLRIPYSSGFWIIFKKYSVRDRKTVNKKSKEEVQGKRN